MRTEIMAVWCVFFKTRQHSQGPRSTHVLTWLSATALCWGEMKGPGERGSCVCRFGRVQETVLHILQGGTSAAPFDRCLLNLLSHNEPLHS